MLVDMAHHALYTPTLGPKG